jgi:hypothetical protein
MNRISQTGGREVAAIITLPPGFEGGGGETFSELKQIVSELRELVKEASAPISFTEKQLAEYFGISELSLARLRRAGKIKYKRVAGKIHYTRRHVEEFLNSEEKKR